jgi:hypothetical protein
VLLLHERPQHLYPLRCRLIPPTPHLSYGRSQPQPPSPLIENFFHL